jgi:hypothetical protein
MKMQTAKLKIGKDGYVELLRCGKGHAGNTRYVLDNRFCQCQGCGNFRPLDACITEQQQALGKPAGYERGGWA